MTDEYFIKRAISLARKGKGNVSPNPLVGAVLVKDGLIIGEGYHKSYGSNHAEVTALKAARADPQGATLYCNLEPCIHWGKTPPCTDAIISSGIKRVVLGIQDPNPIINGRGIQVLREAGIKVVTNVLEEKCRELNEFYIKYITVGQPFVTVKMAQSIDGKITKQIDTRYQLSGIEAQQYVHRLRAEYDAVLIGRRTAEIDNPLLTPRLVKGRVPVRVVLDTHLSLNPDLALFNTIHQGKIIVAIASASAERIKQFQNKGIEILSAGTSDYQRVDIKKLLIQLGKLCISSVFVEGGAEVFTSFLRERLVDKILLIITPSMMGSGVNILSSFSKTGEPIELVRMTMKRLGKDYLLNGIPHYQ
jgi:diaminohydroxyphosphoribosylaminopyrimidine deaminase/5-amino-6-(5-phosphoribosylamino)uracil reductase